MKEPCFIEVLTSPSDHFSNLPDTVDVYISKCDPKLCKLVLAELARILPLPNDSENKPVKHTPSKTTTNPICEDKKTWPYLGHLKRVRRIHYAENGIFSSVVQAKETQILRSEKSVDETKQRIKEKGVSCPNQSWSMRLEILLGSVSQIDYFLKKDDVRLCNIESPCHEIRKERLEIFIRQYGLQLEKRKLPGRPARSQQELDEWSKRVKSMSHSNRNNNDSRIKFTKVDSRLDVNNTEIISECDAWPTIFFEKRTEEYKQQVLELNDSEIEEMKLGLKNALLDGIESTEDWKEMCTKGRANDIGGGHNMFDKNVKMIGAIVVCPRTQKIVSRACEERRTQEQSQILAGREDLILLNPLCSPIILALQGVSRKQRLAALDHGMDSDSFKSGQVGLLYEI